MYAHILERKTTRASTKIDDDAVLKSKRQKVVSPAQSSARDERIMDESDSMDSDELDDEGGSLDIGNANVLDEENTEVSFVVKLTPVSSAEGTGDYAKALFTAKDNELIELKILNQEAIYFSSNKDWVDKPNGTYLIPSQSNWNRIDSLFQPDFAFQMTLSLSHPYNQAELTKQFPEREPLAFVYVVPLSKFNDFRFQKPSGINYRNFLLKNVHQYVMGIPDGIFTFYNMFVNITFLSIESIIEGEMAENKI
jgi:hypothetical protein